MQTKVFISYSHKDEAWKDRLQTQLTVLEMEGMFAVWEDRQIMMGDNWYPAIEKAMNEADIAILLVSADFLTSRFIRGEEIPRLLERRKQEGIRVIPLILKPCPWRKVSWLNAMQGGSKDNAVLSTLSEPQQDQVLSQLAENIADWLNPPTSMTTTTLTLGQNQSAFEAYNQKSAGNSRLSSRTALNATRRQRLQDKLQRLYEQYDLETRVEEKIRMKAIIKQTEDELQDV